MNPELRAAAVDDASEIACLHRVSMPSAFLPRLGNGFMTRFYRALIREPVGVVVVAKRGGRVCGFAAGTTSMPEFARRFKRRYAGPALVAAAPRLIRPSVVKGIAETARYSVLDSDLPDAEWISIAVTHDLRHSGLSGRLMAQLLADLAAAGATDVRAMIASDNQACQMLLQQMGFRRAQSVVVHDQRPSDFWLKLGSDPAPRGPDTAENSIDVATA